jgi:translation initiation factor IF-2
MRVYELAKELGLASKEAVELLVGLGVDVKSHSSSVTEEEAAKLRKAQKPASKPKTTTKKPPKAKVEPKKQPKAEPKAEPKAKAEPPAEKPAQEVEAAPPPEPQPPEPKPAPAGPPIQVSRGATVEELATKLERSPTELIKALMALGEMKTITQSLDDDSIELLAQEFGAAVEIVSPEEEDEEEPDEEEDPALLKERAPVVTVMGHVDHGKSSILQHFRRKEMLSGEAGGITQAIGAYQVHENGKVVTFIDTPGHEAFTQMRARGAQITDVAVLVVAADDGVQPQTIEALDHAKAAGVPIVVAVNKIDRPEADPTRVRQQLSEVGLQPEDWGGDTVFVDVSAKNGTNMDQLLEMILLVSELQELRSNFDTTARGVAIDSHLDKGRGAVATLLVQRGKLKVGSPIVCGAAWAKVRALTDEHGHDIVEAGPSQPVQVTGWSKVPEAGDDFRVMKDDREAKRLAQERESRQRQAEMVAGHRLLSLEELLAQTVEGELPELKLIAKADAQGALEALVDSIEKLEREEVRVTIIRQGVGAITTNDVTLAAASGAIVVGFNVRPDAAARQQAEKDGVDVRPYEVIYQLLVDIQKATRGMLAPIEEEAVLGSAQVRATFRTPKGVIAGCYVTEGDVLRGAKARLLRDGIVIYNGTVGSLRRFKDDVREVATGFECGVGLEGYDDIKEGDVIEVFEIREVART